MTLDALNTFPDSEALDQFSICCGATNWAEQMTTSRPFHSKDALFKAAKEIWFSLNTDDWLEAFSHHPKIGDMESLRKKFQNTKLLSEKEQSGIHGADEAILENLAVSNRLYEDKFGYIFIVCATGKTAKEMLALLKERLTNEPNVELLIAAKEQNTITQLRLETLLMP